MPSLLKYKTTKSNNNNNKLIKSNSRCGCVVFVYLTVMPSPTLYSNWNPTQIGIWTRPLFALSYSCLLYLLSSLLLLLLLLLLHGIHICFCVLDITHRLTHAQLLSYTCLSFTFSCVFLFLFFYYYSLAVERKNHDDFHFYLRPVAVAVAVDVSVAAPLLSV